MSDFAAVSPLLDGYSLGDSVSSHDGILCCPAIQRDTDQKYIVKIISVPASQRQMDALLLAGAYKDPADAMKYFNKQCEEISAEAQLLKELSAQEGFVSYDGWQTVPITKRRLGYQVYLVGQYRRSLDKFLRQHPVTHLEAMNLGLDLCSALSACRQAGSLYVNLKPGNIYVSEKKAYQIGDIGFISLDALDYTVIPDRYRSAYTPPELLDPMAPMNLTVDTYAVGMILYQLYNDGQLPSRDPMPEEGFPSPVNADYELAEIIMRSIHPDPEQRWNDPKDLQQALVGYMQRNAVNDSPISVSAPPAVVPEGLAVFPSVSVAHSAEKAEASPEDETAPGEEDADSLLPHEMSDELSKIVAKADDLIAHEPPPSLVLPEVPEEPDPFAFAQEPEPDDSDIPHDPLMPDSKEETPEKNKEPKFISPQVKRRRKWILSRIALILTLAVIGFCAYWYYQLIYLQPVRSLTLETGTRELSVAVDSDIPDSKLHVVCQDNFGNRYTQELHSGQALFTNLDPNTTYQILLEIDGFHKLTGETSSLISTDTTTQILAFSATAGMEDGSIILEFIPDGEEPPQWTMLTHTDGQENQLNTFTGHRFTVSGLEVGKIYSFTLGAGGGLSLSGKTTIEAMAPRLVLAQDVTFSTQNDTTLTVSWRSPGDIILDSWMVRCYGGSYNQRLTVTDTEAQFVGVDLTESYTVEITAAGMSLPQTVQIPANPISVSDVKIDNEDDLTAEDLRISWNSQGRIPEGGWTVRYSIDGVSVTEAISCDDNLAVISPRIPGAKYRIQIHGADGSTILNSVYTLTCPEAPNLSFYNLTSDTLEGFLLKRPDDPNWSYDTVTAAQEFSSGESISVVLHATAEFYRPGVPAQILYVIRNSQGIAMPNLSSCHNTNWNEVWSNRNYHYSQLDLPMSPTAPGNYTAEIYINGQFAIALPFTIY